MFQLDLRIRDFRILSRKTEDLSAKFAFGGPRMVLSRSLSAARGMKTVRYLVPEMKEILSNTFGVLVYQEQIMQLAQKLAGYTLSEADLMRRAMGKKKREEMALHEQKFINGAVERGIKKEKAEKIFSLMQVFRLRLSRSHAVLMLFWRFKPHISKPTFRSTLRSSVSREAQDAAKFSSIQRNFGRRASSYRGPSTKVLWLLLRGARCDKVRSGCH